MVILLVRIVILTKYSCGPIKLAKALLFCFELSRQLDTLASSLASQSKLPSKLSQQHLIPSMPKPVTKTVQDIVVTESLDIPRPGFVTSSLTRPSTPSSVASNGKLSLMPNVLIVDDNPINVSTVA
jgi:hypothetical protein